MLIETRVKIDGIDITDLIAFRGVKWSRNDIDGPGAGRNIVGDMIRDVVATKIRLDITCRPMRLTELRTLLNLLRPPFVQVTYDDPMDGVVTRTMYANNHSASFLMAKSNGDYYGEYWENISFPLIER